MKKNGVFLLLIAVYLFSFAGCNKGSESENASFIELPNSGHDEQKAENAFIWGDERFQYEPTEDPVETVEKVSKKAGEKTAEGFEFKRAEVDDYETRLEYELRRYTSAGSYEEKGWTKEVFDEERFTVVRTEYYAKSEKGANDLILEGYTEDNPDKFFLGRYVYLVKNAENFKWEISEITDPIIMRDTTEAEAPEFDEADYPYPLSDDPSETVKAYYEHEKKQDYVIRLELLSVKMDSEATEYQCTLLKGSELAKLRGWKNEIFDEGNFAVVTVDYYAEYDNTVVPTMSGKLSRQIWLIRDTQSLKWRIVE